MPCCVMISAVDLMLYLIGERSLIVVFKNLIISQRPKHTIHTIRHSSLIVIFINFYNNTLVIAIAKYYESSQ